MESIKITSLIRNICNKTYKLSELTDFIDISQKIAISYLKYQEVMGKNIRPKKAEGINELDDVAIDCIAGLFMRNENGDFIQLQRFFGAVIANSDDLNDDMLVLMLRRLVVKKTKQELSRIFRERDPESAKIIRNIRVTIRNSGQFSTLKEMGREYVFLKGESSSTETIHINKDKLPEKILFNQFLEQYNPSDSVSVMMKRLFTIANNYTKKNSYIAIDVIASIVRDITFQQFRRQFSNTVDNATPFNELQLKEVHEVNQLVIKKIHQKIENQYLRKNKLSREKADIYSKAIYDFVQDLTQAKECESNFRYLKRYIPTLTQQSYRAEERSIFEYLIKITKKSLRKKLKELL